MSARYDKSLFIHLQINLQHVFKMWRGRLKACLGTFATGQRVHRLFFAQFYAKRPEDAVAVHRRRKSSSCRCVVRALQHRSCNQLG